MTKARGAQGRSTIIKRADGRWHGYVSMGTRGDGKRDRRHVSSVTRAEVVRKVRELEIKRDAGSTSAAGRSMKLEDWLALLGVANSDVDHEIWLTFGNARSTLRVGPHLAPTLDA